MAGFIVAVSDINTAVVVGTILIAYNIRRTDAANYRRCFVMAGGAPFIFSGLQYRAVINPSVPVSLRTNTNVINTVVTTVR